MTTRYITAVIDLQYGSTGKGQIAGTVAKHWKPDSVVTAWGPNAGHTYRDGELQMVSRMLASSAIQPSIENILLGPGSVIDLHTLKKEIEDRGRRHLEGKNLVIHPQAAVLKQMDVGIEQANLVRVGSTMKGTAVAACRKAMREPDAVAKGCIDLIYNQLGASVHDAGMAMSISSSHYDRAIDRTHRLMVEGAQGFSLGLHTDFYPYTTGRDVSTAQLFADCRLPWAYSRHSWPQLTIIGVARTFPIRVANRYDAQGQQVGTSGGCYGDQDETTWDEIGQKVELTTVTQLPRRVFTYSDEQIRQASRLCNPNMIALTFCDYLPADQVAPLAKRVTAASDGVPVRFLSYGPDTRDVGRRMLPLDEVRPLLSTPCDYLEWP